MRGSRVVAVVALVVALTTVIAPDASAGSGPPLPLCRIDDVLTRFHGEGQWRKSVLDTIFKVKRSYVPNRLVSTSRAGLNGGYRVRPVLISDLEAMARAARRAGAGIAVRSAYRSYSTQQAVFAQHVRDVGYDRAVKVSARPGHSEHQLGTTIDFRSANSTRAPWDYADWASTKAGRWMKDNAWKYGFLMSYPKGKRRESCYSYEPWHYRYVGRTLAAEVHASGVTLRRYLWETYHTTEAP